MPSDQKRAPSRKHEILLVAHFWDFTCVWVGLCSFYLFYLNYNSKDHKCSGLFFTKFHILWFSTLVILLVKHVNLSIWLKFVCKGAYPDIIILLYFRALWLETTWATGAPTPLLAHTHHVWVHVHMER